MPACISGIFPFDYGNTNTNMAMRQKKMKWHCSGCSEWNV